MEEPLSQLLTTGPSLSHLLWMCWLLRQLAFTGCTLKCYWIPLLPRQHAPTNHSLWLGMLLLRGRLKACSALCGKSWKEQKKTTFQGEKINKFYLQQSGAEYVRREATLIGLPVSGPIFSPSRHSWRISLLAVESASKKNHEKCSSHYIYLLKHKINRGKHETNLLSVPYLKRHFLLKDTGNVERTVLGSKISHARE